MIKMNQTPEDWGQLLRIILACVFLAFWIVLRLLHIIALIYGKWKLYRRADLSQFTEKSLPGVSILKPLINTADPSLFQNLETFFTLDYPKYEILFCIQETDDSKMKMYVDSLMQKYPAVQSKVFYAAKMSVSIPRSTTCIRGTRRPITNMY